MLGLVVWTLHFLITPPNPIRLLSPRYRRQGWQYGVISLDESLPADHVPDGGRDRGYGESKAGAAE